MDRYHLRETVVRLVESYHDRQRARGALTRFEGTSAPPQEPGEFPNLDAFLDFHDAKCEYEDTLQGLRDELKRQEDTYERLSARLRASFRQIGHCTTTTTESAGSSSALDSR